MNRFLVCLAALLLLASCGRSPRRFGVQFGGQPQGGGQVTAGGGNPQGGPVPTAQGTDPLQIVNQLDQYLRSQGYTGMGNVLRGNLPTGGLTGYAVQAQPGACYVIFAVADPNADVDLVVTDFAGRMLGRDVHTDPHPWVASCPGTGGRLTSRVSMASGGGQFLYAAYQGPPNRQIDLAAFFGGGGGQQVQTAQIDGNTQARLAALERRLSGTGYQRVGEPVGIVMGESDVQQFPIQLVSGACYSFATLGGPGTSDTDVFLADGGGNDLQSDTSTDVDGVITDVCPSQPGSYILKVRMYSGQGSLFIASFARGQQGGGGTTVATTPVVTGGPQASSGLEENFRVLDGEMRARGYEVFGQPERGELDEGGTRDISVELEGGKCYAMVAVGDNGVRDLDLLLSDPRNQPVDRDVEPTARPTVRVCPQQSGTYHMNVRMFAGEGPWVYGAYRWPRGTSGPFGMRGIQWVRASEMLQLLELDGYQLDTDYTPERAQFRRESESRSHNLQLTAGKCYAVLVTGGEGVSDLDTTLSQGSTQLATDGSRNAFPTVRYCPTATGRYELGIRSAMGQGPYVIQLFAQTQ